MPTGSLLPAFEGSITEEKWELKQVARSCGVRGTEIEPITAFFSRNVHLEE